MDVFASTPADRPTFIQCDWINVEGRLTAHFSGDVKLQARLDAELTGGPKVHAINAALIYGPTHGVTPTNAKDVYVTLQGQQVPAYDGGKRTTHLWNYGGTAKMIAEQFWISKAEAERVMTLLAGEYTGVVAWRIAMADEVFGVGAYRCGRCGVDAITSDDCRECAKRGVRSRPTWLGWATEPAREHRTPFGRRRQYLGRRSDGIKPLTAQDPQSSGASMWYATLCRLHGFTVLDGGAIDEWPTPDGALVWRPGMSYRALVDRRAPIRVTTGTYDSFLVRTPYARVDEVAQWTLATMEVPWAVLDGRRFPADLAIGFDWAPVDYRCVNCGHRVHDGGWCTGGDGSCTCTAYVPRHTTGLRESKYRPLTARLTKPVRTMDVGSVAR